MNSLPLVTLGLPAYNEAEFLRATLDTLLAQTYARTEIIVGDNGSTDATSTICAEYAAKHPNIFHVKHPRNIGQNANFNYLPRCASGTYFAWASAHDLFDPEWVERCVAALESHPEAVLAYPRTVYTDKDGKPQGEKPRRFDIRDMSPSQRFREVMWRVDCNVVYGMWRLAPMLNTPLFRLFPAADRVFLAEMAIKGPFVPVDVRRYSRANRGGPQPEMEKRHRLMAYIFPHRTFTDAEIAGNAFYAPTLRGFCEAVLAANFPVLVRWHLLFSIWLCGVMKLHLFPGADAMSWLVKKVMPRPLLAVVLRQMQ